MQWKLEPSPATGSSARIGLWISIALGLLVALLFISGRRAGLDWGGDFALYISHARALSEGRSYADTGYIVNPYARFHSPSTYPPLFPALLAPLYHRYGIDLSILELPAILCFAASIPVLFSFFRRDLGAVQSLIAVTLWAAWPYSLWFKDSVMPDFVFVLIWATALWMLRITYDEFPLSRPVARAIPTGLVAYAAYATRSGGLVLPCAIVCYELLRYKKISPFARWVIGVFGILAVCQNLFIHNEASYLQMFIVDPVKTIRIYYYAICQVLSGALFGWLRGVRNVATVAVLLLSCAGFVVNLRRLRSPLELAVGMYIILLVLWSSGSGTHYMFPVMPFFFFYIVIALDAMNRNFHRVGPVLESALLILILICYVTEDRRYISERATGGVFMPDFVALCRYITQNTSPPDVFIFQNPRVLSLYTRRPASVYPAHGNPSLVWSYSHTIHARYVVVSDFMEGDDETLLPFVRDYGDHLNMVFSDPHFRLYAFRD